MSWSTGKGVLEGEVAKAKKKSGIHIVGLQKHGLVSKDWCDEVSASIFSPAARIDLGVSAGTALCIPACVGIRLEGSRRGTFPLLVARSVW